MQPLSVSIRNYRRVAAADLELAPIALVAGLNEAGKSSLVQAFAAALSGNPAPAGTKKKDAADELVRDGEKLGHAKVSDGGGTAAVVWPKCAVANEGETAPSASPVAVGLVSPLDMPERDRASFLNGILDCKPSMAELAAAMADIGFKETAVAAAWASIEKQGWDATLDRAREHGAELKGRWRQETGETWGAEKAADWNPKDFEPDLIDADEQDLQRELDEAKAAHEATIGAAAIDASRIEDLKAKAARKGAVQANLDETRADLAEAETLLEALKTERGKLPGGPAVGAELTCVECGSVNVLVPGTPPRLAKAEKVSDADLKKRRMAVADLDGKVENAKTKVSTLGRDLARMEADLIVAVDAAAELEAMQDPAGEAPPVADRAVAALALETAEGRLRAFRSKREADKLHRQIVANVGFQDVLKPEGLRRRKLAQALDPLHDRLKDLSDAAGWKMLQFDESLAPLYGHHPYRLVSESAQWRARTLLQVTLAVMDGSAAVAIDHADMLDAAGRNGLFKMLAKAGIRALVAMTANKPDKVPDLARAKLGNSYWLDAGQAAPLAALAAAAE